jgi:hypothetical protein
MSELALLFPPQWSPFQPPMSIPSLSAWLRREGFSVTALDANIEFYHWLSSGTAIACCREMLNGSALPPDDRLAYNAILDAAPQFRQDVERLQSLGSMDTSDDQEILKAHFVAIHSLSLLLQTISNIAQDFKISPFGFQTKGVTYKAAGLERLLETPPPLLALFVDEYIERFVIPLKPASLGLSCIGQEQLFFTLLFGWRVEQLLDIPVLIGGTIFSRIFERGVLPAEWFGKYFDIIVRNEGERPAAAILRNLVDGKKLVEDVPGIVYLDEAGTLISSAPCAPLRPRELPIPDFDDFPLNRYITGHVSLPVLASRGCYWGKCEFCHHGMVYGEKYEAYEADAVLATVTSHAKRYGARHFAFNDEAIPPKIVRRIGDIFPAAAQTSWAFTGLIKFEKYFEKSDFTNLYRIGFRSLYVGLESASERVLRLMRKPNSKETIVANLADATEAGIWMHCFLFFGFPGENEADAQETYDFVLENDAIIGSFGCGTFSLEHNAPIFHHLQDFRVDLEQVSRASVNVYYDYRVSDGISAERASEWADRLREEARKRPRYFAAGWVPREHLLSLLASMTPARLMDTGEMLRESGGIPDGATTREVFSLAASSDCEALVAVNRVNRRVLRLEGVSAEILRLLYNEDTPLDLLREQSRPFYERLTAPPLELA